MKCIICDGSGLSEEPRKPSVDERTLEKMGFYIREDEYACRACKGLGAFKHCIRLERLSSVLLKHKQ